MTEILVDNKIFKCVLKKRVLRETENDLELMNGVLNNYLQYHKFDKGTPLFREDEDGKIVVDYREKDAALNSLIKKLNLLEDVDIKRFLNSKISSEIMPEESDVNEGKLFLSIFLNERANMAYLNFIIKLIDMYPEVTTTCMIIAKSFTPAFKKEVIEQQMTLNKRIILYTDDHFVNIQKHAFSPHPPVIFRGVDQQKLEVKKQELPKLLLSDPYAKYYMLEKDDIVEIRRETGVQDYFRDTSLNYRHVTMINEDIDDQTNTIIE